MTANGEVRTREEATVQVKQLDLLVTVMLLEETPAVLSLEKLCEGSEEVQSDLLHDLPDCLQDFRENLGDESSPSEPRGNPAP